MPVAQQPSQQHHHHLFSAIGTFLHALQPSHHNNPNPNSSVSSSSSLSSHGSSELPDLYQAFESQLAQRLSSLLPAEDSPSVSLSSLKQLMGLLLATQTDFGTVIPTHWTQIKYMEEFLERSIKLLDVCRGIKEQMLEMEILQGMLNLVILCLNSDKGDTSQGQVNRARKALAQLLLHLEVEREDQTSHGCTHRSFRGRLRERLGGNGTRESSPQRWRSWHGNSAAASLSHGNHGSVASALHVNVHGNNASTLGNHVPAHVSHVSAPSLHVNHGAHGAAGSAVHAGGNPGSQTLHTLELSLLPPKLPPKDEEECFSAAIYALNVLSIFSLGTITAAFPSYGKTHSAGFIHPPHAVVWASPFLRLQEKVDEELSKRSKKHGGYAGMWELDQICFLAKRLFELISLDEFPKLDHNKEEAKKVIKLFCQHVQELERDMGALHSQINEFYNRVVAARMGVLDLRNDAND